MLKIIRNLLLQIINDIDSGNSNDNEEELQEILNIIQKMNSKELSKVEASKYIGVSKATFDNYIRRGLIPEGRKRQGLQALFWNKVDLDNYLKTKDN